MKDQRAALLTAALLVAFVALVFGCKGTVGLSQDGFVPVFPDAGTGTGTGNSDAGGGGSTVTELWKKTHSQMGKVNALTVDGDNLLVSSATGLHVLLLPGKGNLRCSKFTGSNQNAIGVKAAVTVDSGTAYFTRSSERCLGAISVSDCNGKWSLSGNEYFDCKAASDTQPVLAQGNVLVIGTVTDGGNDAHVWGVNASDGQQSFHHKLNGHDIRRSLAAQGSGATLYLGAQVTGVGALYKLSSPGYAPQKILDANRIAAPPLVQSGSVVIGDWSGVLHSVDGSGSKQWTWQVPSGQAPIFSAPVASGGKVLVAVSLHGVYATNAGKKVWTYEISSVQFSGVAVDGNGVAYVGGTTACGGNSDGGCVYAIRDGKLVWQYDAGSVVNATPVVANGVVYAGTESGTVVALPVAK